VATAGDAGAVEWDAQVGVGTAAHPFDAVFPGEADHQRGTRQGLRELHGLLALHAVHVDDGVQHLDGGDGASGDAHDNDGGGYLYANLGVVPRDRGVLEDDERVVAIPVR